jgi:hypothetical protein
MPDTETTTEADAIPFARAMAVRRRHRTHDRIPASRAGRGLKRCAAETSFSAPEVAVAESTAKVICDQQGSDLEKEVTCQPVPHVWDRAPARHLKTLQPAQPLPSCAVAGPNGQLAASYERAVPL